jgi:hypothetical protein
VRNALSDGNYKIYLNSGWKTIQVDLLIMHEQILDLLRGAGNSKQ